MFMIRLVLPIKAKKSTNSIIPTVPPPILKDHLSPTKISLNTRPNARWSTSMVRTWTWMWLLLFVKKNVRSRCRRSWSVRSSGWRGITVTLCWGCPYVRSSRTWFLSTRVRSIIWSRGCCCECRVGWISIWCIWRCTVVKRGVSFLKVYVKI
jgi:hypothetical protein